MKYEPNDKGFYCPDIAVYEFHFDGWYLVDGVEKKYFKKGDLVTIAGGTVLYPMLEKTELEK